MALRATTNPPKVPTPTEVAGSPELFGRTFLRILDKEKRLVPLILNDVQRDYLGKRTRRDLILKARQQGFSTLIQGEWFRISTTRTAACMTLGKDDDNTSKLRRMFQRFYEKLPKEVPKPIRKLDNASVITFADFDSEVLIATAGSTGAGRGGTYTHIHGSEAAFWPDAEDIVASALQGGNPKVVLESTPNGAQGYFYNLCMEALDGNNDWRLHFYAWWHTPEYRLPLEPDETLIYTAEEMALVEKHGLTAEQIKWRRSKQRELKHLFAQEYPEDPRECFLRSGIGYMGNIDGVFTAPMDATPQQGRHYVAGLDFGQQDDYTVLSVIDTHTRMQVALVRVNKMSWADMRAEVRKACQRWNVRVLKPEANSMGSTNIEALQAEFAQHGVGTQIEPFFTLNANKASAMSALREQLHEGDLRLLDIPEQKHEMRALQAKQLPSLAWQIAAPPKEHDDIPIANMLAVDAWLNPNTLSFGKAPDWLTNYRG